MVREVRVIRREKQRQVGELPSEGRFAFCAGGVREIGFPDLKRVELMKERCEGRGEMRLPRRFAEHGEVPGALREETAQDELLHERRQRFAGIFAELLKNAVRQAGEPAHRDVRKSAAGKRGGQHGLRAVRALIRHEEARPPVRGVRHVAGDVGAAPGSLSRAGPSENKME